MNLATLSGNLGRDPELRQHNGDNILNFPIGVQIGTKDKPETMWVDCALWGKRATSLQPYMAKGQRVTVSGPIKLEAYTAKDGTPKTRLRLSVDQIDLPPKGDAPAQTQQAQQAKPAQAPSSGFDDMDDDIPF
jgi:single-strand DNA-binding protein